MAREVPGRDGKSRDGLRIGRKQTSPFVPDIHLQSAETLHLFMLSLKRKGSASLKHHVSVSQLPTSHQFHGKITHTHATSWDVSARVFAGDLGPRHRRYGASGKRIGSKDTAAVSVWLRMLVRPSVIEALIQFGPVSFYSASTHVPNKHISSQSQTKGGTDTAYIPFVRGDRGKRHTE